MLARAFYFFIVVLFVTIADFYWGVFLCPGDGNVGFEVVVSKNLGIFLPFFTHKKWGEMIPFVLGIFLYIFQLG